METKNYARALKDEPDNVYICIIGEISITKDNFDDFFDILTKAGLWLGYTEGEITEIDEEQPCTS